MREDSEKRRDRAHDVARHLAALPAHQEAALRLMYFAGVSSEAGATQLGIATHTFRDDASLGMRRLGRMIEETALHGWGRDAVGADAAVNADDS